jgi:hypothetical protein
MEFMLAALFFALCAAVCLGAFARADAVSRRAQAMERAVIEAQSIAETACDGGEAGFAARYAPTGMGTRTWSAGTGTGGAPARRSTPPGCAFTLGRHGDGGHGISDGDGALYALTACLGRAG